MVTEGASKIKLRWLITKEMGAKNFAMRIFELEPNGHSPLHKHPWEHEIFILEGEGQIFDGEKAMPLRAGAVIFVQANDIHQFSASGKKI